MLAKRLAHFLRSPVPNQQRCPESSGIALKRAFLARSAGRLEEPMLLFAIRHWPPWDDVSRSRVNGDADPG